MALYHSTSNGPVEVKKHQLMGPVGYTVVGSPTISDGVVSGFSSSDYLSVNIDSWDLSANVYEVEISLPNAKKSGLPFGMCNLFIQPEAGHYYIKGPKSGGGNGYFAGTGNSFQEGDNVKLKIKYSLGNFEIRMSINGSAYGETTSSPTEPSSTSGVSPSSLGVYSIYPYTGSIDLNETYIKVNGKLWFYQPAPTKYIQKDDKLVFASQNLYLTGPNNYTITGSPNIVDGIASGFDSSNYLSIPNSNLNTSSIEMQVCGIATEIQSGGGALFGYYKTSSALGKIGLQDGNPQWDFSDAVIRGSSTVPLNTKFYLKGILSNGTATLYYKDATNPSWVTIGTTSASTFQNYNYGINIGIGDYAPGGIWTFSGSIDLNETYIKIDDNLWFYGKNYASKNIAPVPSGYTYGNTTTSSIGYVDMRTQAFTAAPSGAIIGMEEL